MLSAFRRAETSIGLSDAGKTAFLAVEIEIVAADVSGHVQKRLHVFQFFPRPMNQVFSVDEMDALQREILQPTPQIDCIAADFDRRPSSEVVPGNELVESGIRRVSVLNLNVITDGSDNWITKN